MRELYLTLCTFVIIGFVNCQYYFVTAPNVIRFEHDETVVVSVFGLNNARVKVGLQYKGRKFSEKVVVVKNEAEPQTTSIRVKESDIFGISAAEDKPRTLQIYSEYQGTYKTRDVVISYQSGYLIVQTDKPIYTPRQKGNKKHIDILRQGPSEPFRPLLVKLCLPDDGPAVAITTTCRCVIIMEKCRKN